MSGGQILALASVALIILALCAMFLYDMWEAWKEGREDARLRVICLNQKPSVSAVACAKRSMYKRAKD